MVVRKKRSELDEVRYARGVVSNAGFLYNFLNNLFRIDYCDGIDSFVGVKYTVGIKKIAM